MPRPGHSLELLVGGRHQTHSGTTETEGPKLSKPEAGESSEKIGELPPAAAELACGCGGGGGGGLSEGLGERQSDELAVGLSPGPGRMIRGKLATWTSHDRPGPVR